MSARSVRKVCQRYAKQELQMLQIGFPITQHFNANNAGAGVVRGAKRGVQVYSQEKDGDVTVNAAVGNPLKN